MDLEFLCVQDCGEIIQPRSTDRLFNIMLYEIGDVFSVYLSELRIENFRMFGEGERAFVLPLRAGLTAIVGENDAGKTAVIDALRLALGTRDQEFYRVEEADFHQPADGTMRCKEIRIRCKFNELTIIDKSSFAEYLTYEDHSGNMVPVLYINWKAVVLTKRVGQRKYISVEARSGQFGKGPQLDAEARMHLCATYLRPLRDAERALSAGRGSRLSQILQHTKEIREHGQDYDPQDGLSVDPRNLSVLGIGDYANALLGNHQGVQNARNRLNSEYLKNLSFSGDQLRGSISVSGSKGDTEYRLRQLLEKLELELRDERAPEPPPSRGLGSNNILFMACEMLLLESDTDEFPLLLIEEPEAHLHPQRQLRLMQFLQEKASEPRPDGQQIQIIVTTHSPNLTSAIDLDNLVLLHGGKAFPMAFGQTHLEKSDYGFLKRFLDVTKANLFFARGLLIVEGDAENILLPTLARLIDRNLAEYGVSIANVGGTGLRRFARIYQRKHPEKDGIINIPVACVADYDVMPDCAPVIIKKVKPGEELPNISDRRWRVKGDFTVEGLKTRRKEIRARASGQKVETFVADEWTLEYDLAFYGLAKYVWTAVCLAREDEQINTCKKTRKTVIREALRSYAEVVVNSPTNEELASHVYGLLASNSNISKATSAQYLASLLESRHKKRQNLRSILPPYLVQAIDHVTLHGKRDGSSGKESAQASEGATHE